MRGHNVRKLLCLTVVKGLFFLCCLLPAGGYCQRALIVTTYQSLSALQQQVMWDTQNGEYVLTDLVAAGYPFDIVTYSKFVAMDLGDHDVIILNGHTSPVPVSQVSSKCQQAVQAGRKVFINGYWPFRRYSASGDLIETLNFAPTLFPVSALSPSSATGTASVAASIEKDPAVTNCGMSGALVNRYQPNEPPPLSVSINGHTVGFLYANGGLIDSSSDYFLNVLDYGKIATYLRYGNNGGIGFANDRIDGMPIASFEVHCDLSYNLTAIANLDAAAAQYGVALHNLLVYKNLNTASRAAWNAITNPLMRIGSHSRTHPYDWPSVPDLAYETTGAIAAQKLVIPATRDYLNFSGCMNPNSAQIDQLNSWGLTFGATGSTWRSCRLPNGGWLPVQLMPTTRTWFVNLYRSNATTYCLSQTLSSDHGVWKSGADYTDHVQDSFTRNSRYGLYTYGYIHDYCVDPSLGYATNGILMYDQIRSAFDYLKSQGVKFVFTDDLILRLRDYQQGSITRDPANGNPATVTVTRPNALANEIKIGFMGDYTPVASGSSVLSQRLVGERLYVTLKPETTSTVTVNWSLTPPVRPIVSSAHAYINSSSSVQWFQPVHPGGIAEYQYAIGSTPGGNDVYDWCSAGTETHIALPDVQLAHKAVYYVSVKARYEGSGWSEPGISPPLIADLTPPETPTVIDDGETQTSTYELHARWTAVDPESGTIGYKYAMGKQPGSTDLKDWTDTNATEVTERGLPLFPGQTYYVSVKAKNALHAWSAVGASDGIRIAPRAGSYRGFPDGALVDVENVVVTRTFPGEYYVQGLDRSSGIKVVSAEPVQEGCVLRLAGTISHDGAERYLKDVTVTVTGTASAKPLLVSAKSLGGSTDGWIQGCSGGTGMNNVGLLVKVMGRITDAPPGCIYVDDGSAPCEDGVTHSVRVNVQTPHAFQVGSYVMVTGISALVLSDSSAFRRSVRIRSNSDVVILTE